MKKIKKIVFLITVGMIMIFTNGCNQDVNVTAQNPQQNEKNEDDQNDVNQDDDTNKDPEQNDYYNIDYSNSPIFNKTSKISQFQKMVTGHAFGWKLLMHLNMNIFILNMKMHLTTLQCEFSMMAVLTLIFVRLEMVVLI